MSAALQPVKRDPMDAGDESAVSIPGACGAKLRGKDEHCGLPSGYGTPHVGAGRCKYHGGLSPVKHGRYSGIRSERLQQVLANIQQDHDPLDLVPDVEMLRTLFVDYINRYDETTTALLAWYESYEIRRLPPSERLVRSFEMVVTEYEIMIAESRPGEVPDRVKDNLAEAKKFLENLKTPDTGRPRQILDIADAKSILAEAGRMVERIEKIRSANAISRPELNRIYHEMWRVVDAEVEDDGIKARIKDYWLRIHL